MITSNDFEASTSRQPQSDESDHEDLNRGRIRENIACLIAKNQSKDSNKYERESFSNASGEIGMDIIQGYATQPNVGGV